MKLDTPTLFYLLQRSKRYDVDASAYFNRAIVVDAVSKRRISNLFCQLKSLGLWDNLAEGWSFRSDQNTGTGSVVRGFRESADFTLFNGATWATAGVSFDGISQWAQTTAPLTMPRTVFAVFRLDGAQNSRSMVCGLQTNSSNGVVFIGTSSGGGALGFLDYFPLLGISGSAGSIYGGAYTSAASATSGSGTTVFKNGASLNTGGVITEDLYYAGTRIANHGGFYNALTMVAMFNFNAVLDAGMVGSLHAACKQTIAEDLPLS